MTKTGVYIHVPFCRRKCAYCDFYSVCDLSPMDDYVDALCREIRAAGDDRLVDTIFVGGGTPSLLRAAQWRRIFDALTDAFILDYLEEFTVECNPESCSAELFDALRSLGVNRLSIGVQSLQDEVLAVMGRVHTADEALAALRMAHTLFANVNADYIVGLPHQTAASVTADLAAMLPFVRHVSVYALQLEEGTPIERSVRAGRIALPAEDEAAALYQAAADYLQAHGLTRYEVSNFAASGYQCRHNQHCWQSKEYMGFGPAAHSFAGGRRFYHSPDLAAYMADCTRYEEEGDNTLSDRKEETIMLGLRTTLGVDLAAYYERFGVDFCEEYASVLTNPLVRKTCSICDGYFRIDPELLYVSNQISLLFLNK